MPCYTIRRVSVEFTATDEAVLTRAIEASGLTVHLGSTAASVAKAIIATGQLTVVGRATPARVEEIAGTLKRAYAAEAVQTAAKKYGWNLKVNQQTQQRTLTKRTF